jgi:hypothetical protein
MMLPSRQPSGERVGSGAQANENGRTLHATGRDFKHEN